MRHFAGWKNQQQPTAADMIDRSLQRPSVRKPILLAFEWIDKNAKRSQFRQFAQHPAGQHPDIGTHSAEKFRQQRPVQNPERMIGKRDHGPGGRYALEIGRRDTRFYVQFLENTAEKRRTGSSLIVEILQPIDLEEPVYRVGHRTRQAAERQRRERHALSYRSIDYAIVTEPFSYGCESVCEKLMPERRQMGSSHRGIAIAAHSGDTLNFS